MKPTERIDYDPIQGRPALQLPGGARVAVWLIVNVEEWSATEPMPRTVLTPPAGGVPSPDVPNWSWHEYGNRVGFWRMLRVLDRHAIPVALAVNGSAIEAYPQITAAAAQRRWEFIGHGYTQKNMQKVPDERRDIQLTRDAIAAATGRCPRGWLGPGLTETWETPDLLVEEGYEYISARVMALVVHPYIMGAPHRLKYLDMALEHIRAHDEAVFLTGEQILDWYAAARPEQDAEVAQTVG
jgi:hypothetical protein